MENFSLIAHSEEEQAVVHQVVAETAAFHIRAHDGVILLNCRKKKQTTAVIIGQALPVGVVSPLKSINSHCSFITSSNIEVVIKTVKAEISIVMLFLIVLKVIEISEVVVGRVGGQKEERVVLLENIRDVAGVVTRLEVRLTQAALSVFRFDDRYGRLQRVKVAHTALVSHIGLDGDIAVGHFLGLIIIEDTGV